MPSVTGYSLVRGWERRDNVLPALLIYQLNRNRPTETDTLSASIRTWYTGVAFCEGAGDEDNTPRAAAAARSNRKPAPRQAGSPRTTARWRASLRFVASFWAAATTA